MGISDLAPELAKFLHLQPSTLVLFIVVLNIACRAITRAIPDDAVGWLGAVRRATAVIAAEVDAKVTSGVTVKDVARASLATPPITDKVADATGESVDALASTAAKDTRV